MTQQNFRIVAKNLFDQATISVDAETELASTLPLTNLQIYNNSRVARFTSTAQSIIYGNLEEPNIVNCVVVWRHTLTDLATWRVRLFSGINQTGTVLFDNGEGLVTPPKALDELNWGIDPLESGIFTGFGKSYAHVWTDDLLVASFEITIKEPDETVDYVDVARIYIGKYFSTEVNVAYGIENSLIDNSIQLRTAGGSIWTTTQQKYRRLSFDLLNLTPGERSHAFEVFNYAGKLRDVFVSIFPEVGGMIERDFSFAGKFTDSPSSVHDFYSNFSTKFVIEEA